MRLECCQNGNLNVGDDLNYWLWPKLLPGLLDEDKEHAFLGIGTLLTEKRMNKQLAHARSISILSSGAWGPQAPKVAPHWKVYGVRGPKTAEWIGVSPSLVVGDGAYLIRRFISLPEIASKTSPVAFIPHHRSEDYVDWKSICRNAGVQYVSPRQDIESFAQQMSTCRLVLAEAMHGAIIADALRIPWAPVKFSTSFREDKWLDWAESMSLALSFIELPHMYQQHSALGKRLETNLKALFGKVGINREKWGQLSGQKTIASVQDIELLVKSLERAKSENRWQLSSDHAIETIEQKLYHAVERIKLDN